jgi:hypothetical protein
MIVNQKNVYIVLKLADRKDIKSDGKEMIWTHVYGKNQVFPFWYVTQADQSCLSVYLKDFAYVGSFEWYIEPFCLKIGMMVKECSWSLFAD